MSDIAVPRAPSRINWFAALRTQANVIGALILRELHTRYGRENVGYLWMILEPMTLAVGVALIHAAAPQHGVSDIQAVPFSTLGYCIFIMFRGIFNRAEGTIEANMPLLYHRMVTVFDFLFARALLEAAGTTATFFVLLFFGVSFGLCDWPYRPLHLLAGLAFMAWFSFAMSTLVCSATHENRLLGRLVHPISYLLMPVSGAFYMLIWIPEPYRSWLLWFPMPHIFELARYGQFRAATDRFYDINYLAGSCLVLTTLGLISLRIVRRHVHLH